MIWNSPSPIVSRRLLWLFVAVMQSGCVGYNHTLFMTKSNAGLDIDSAPPTVEVNISRKEAVVAPAFEGGQTPPVIASFGSDVGSGAGAGRFFFGVNQTFAGGDAALTLGTLYEDPREPTGSEENLKKDFDSTLKLSEMPRANQSSSAIKRFLFGLPEPGEVRPFVFGTDSQLGIKVGWNGVGGPYPDTLKIGYNRKEFAFAPVTLQKDTTPGVTKPYAVRMPSFLATVDSNVTGADNVKVGWMQYFATGAAADQLAREPAVRAAMIARSDPAQDAEIKDVQLRAQELILEQDARITKIVACVARPDGSVDATKLNGLLAPSIRDGKIDASVDAYLGSRTTSAALRKALQEDADSAISPLYAALPAGC